MISTIFITNTVNVHTLAHSYFSAQGYIAVFLRKKLY